MDARPARAVAEIARDPRARFLRDAPRSYGDPASENRLFIAENLGALRALRRDHAGRFRCVYLDPPFNTGRAFAEYTDRRAPREWEDMIAERLDAIAPLVADDGAVFAEIDDTEVGTLQRRMDETFGRENRVSTVTIVRSAPTGHKAKNRGPVNVTDFLLVYAKDKARWRCASVVRPRRDYDDAYGTFVVNRDGPMETWRLAPLARQAAEALGHATAAHARRALGRAAFTERMHAFALAHANAVARLAQPRFEAVSRAARELIVQSRSEPERIFCLPREGHPPLLLKGGNRLLFLESKVAVQNGKRVLVEPLTNLWDDVPFQGIAKEGGVVFSRNKKPERLLERIVAMSTEPGDWVLDPFLGSGTTAAVAHKMGRRWVGIEEGDHADALCIPRLRRVVDGTDATGITRTHGWRGGGGFAVYT